jgi:choline dehydrogenase
MFRGSDQYWDNFDAAVGSPGTFTAAAVHSTYQEFEWLNDHGRYASTPTRGNGQTPGQTWKLDVFPRNNITGYDEERMGLLMSGALGLPMYTDQSYNNPGYTYGVFPYMEFFWDFNTSNPELRWTSRAAFAGPEVMNQETYIGNYPRRLSMFLNSTVFKLLHAPGPVFTGVQFRGRDGVVRNAYAAKEVIISAGVNTAALMLRSGIGPASVLQSAGVTPVLVNNNLGQKMYSHVGTSVVAVWNNITGINPDGTPVVPFCATVAADTTPSAVPGQRGFELNNIAFAPGLMLIGFGKMHQLSYGSSEIYTGDPLQLQKMITNVLTDPADLTSYRKIIRDVVWGINNENPGIFIVSIDNTTLNSDALLDEWLSQNAFPLNHYFMNTNMGTDPATSVLNNRFQVWNARNLRVCDTQAYATLVDVHPSYNAALLGQICGKMVLEDHGSPAAKAAHPVHRKPANKRKASPTSPQKRDIVAPSEHNFMTRDDATLWGEYQHAIQQIELKFTASQRDQLLSAIRKTSEYVRLCAMYCQQ